MQSRRLDFSDVHIYVGYILLESTPVNVIVFDLIRDKTIK